MKRQFILFLDEVNKKDLPLVGGKGANLGEMTKAGFPIPDGFCLTTEAYKEFIADNKLFNFIRAEIKDARLENINIIGARIREKITQAEISEAIIKEILRSVKTMGIDNYYAVRSSSTAEDLSFASFAGQQDTYLNIRGEEALLTSIKDCFASLFTDRAILYRIQNKIEHEQVLMSVVVQKMVLAELSGLMFTADPLSGHRGIISIEGTYGLGEALVSGLVSPDIYRVNKHSLKIEDKTISEKKTAIMANSAGGTEKIEIIGKKSISEAMTDSQVKILAQLGMKVENHFEKPQDIEWCMQGNNIYIVQSRPITTLFPLPEPLPRDDKLHAYLSLNHVQVMTDPISPLGLDIIRIMITPDKAARMRVNFRFIPTAAGRMYADVSGFLKFRTVRTVMVMVLKNMDALLGESLAKLINKKEFITRVPRRKISVRVVGKFFIPSFIRVGRNLVFKNPEGAVELINKSNQRYEEKLTKIIRNAEQGVEKLETIKNVSCFIDEFLKVMLPYLVPGLISLKILEKMEQKLLATNNYVNAISRALEGNVTTEMGLLTGDLADMVRNSPELIKEFENEDYRSLIHRIDNLKNNDEFKSFFKNFMNKYGVRAAGEIDIAKDRWLENPEPLARAILAIASSSEEGLHRKEYKTKIKEAELAAVEMVNEVRSKRGKLIARIVKRLIKVLRNNLPVREHHKFLMIRQSMIIKKALLKEAELLVKKGHLAKEKDIFYVRMQELSQAIKNEESLLKLVELRKKEEEYFKKLQPPRVLTSQGEEIKASLIIKDLPKNALVGIAVSSGIIEGIAKVITDPSAESINKGEILVAHFTDPGWTPLFINAAGLVMEIGGHLTHGTVVAREYGIPAVVGIADATKNIKTGQRIKVNGDAGYVLII